MLVILGWLALVMLVIIVRISSGFLWPEDIGLVVDRLVGWLVGQKEEILVRILIEPLLVDASWTLDSGPGSSCTPLRIVSVCVTIVMVMWSVKSLMMM